MHRGIIIFIVLFIFLSTLFFILPPLQLYQELTQGEISIWYIVALSIGGAIFSGIAKYITYKFPAEYGEAKRISHTPYPKYGWYALLFFFGLFFCIYAYFFIEKLL